MGNQCCNEQSTMIRQPEYLWYDYELNYVWPNIEVPDYFLDIITEEEINSIPAKLKLVGDESRWHWFLLLILMIFIITIPLGLWNIYYTYRKLNEKLEEVNSELLKPKGIRAEFYPAKNTWKNHLPNILALYLLKNDITTSTSGNEIILVDKTSDLTSENKKLNNS